MNRKITFLFLFLVCVIGWVSAGGPEVGYDPGAVRRAGDTLTGTVNTASGTGAPIVGKDYIDATVATAGAAITAHQASTTTAVHGLGSMSGEASTDYVATDTFTVLEAEHDGHVASTTTSVHGLGSMSGAATTDYVATNTFTTLEAEHDSHVASTGTTVHGLGTMATQASTDYVASGVIASTYALINGSSTQNFAIQNASVSSAMDVEGLTRFNWATNAVKILGHPAYPSNSSSDRCSLDIWGGYVMAGSVSNSSLRTNATNKLFHLLLPHYTNVNYPLEIIGGLMTVASNAVYIGGGNGFAVAATSLNFYTAANSNTTTGTLRGHVDHNGRWSLGTSTAMINAGVNIGTDTYIQGAATVTQRLECLDLVIPARMASAAINALGVVPEGATTYDTDSHVMVTFDGTVWRNHW